MLHQLGSALTGTARQYATWSTDRPSGSLPRTSVRKARSPFAASFAQAGVIEDRVGLSRCDDAAIFGVPLGPPEPRGQEGFAKGDQAYDGGRQARWIGAIYLG